MIQDRMLSPLNHLGHLQGVDGSNETVTHRCRVYREYTDVFPGKDYFVEVWDTLDVECMSNLPEGEIVAVCVGQTTSEVRDKVDDVIRQHDYPLTGCWNLRGSL